MYKNAPLVLSFELIASMDYLLFTLGFLLVLCGMVSLGLARRKSHSKRGWRLFAWALYSLALVCFFRIAALFYPSGWMHSAADGFFLASTLLLLIFGLRNCGWKEALVSLVGLPGLYLLREAGSPAVALVASLWIAACVICAWVFFKTALETRGDLRKGFYISGLAILFFLALPLQILNVPPPEKAILFFFKLADTGLLPLYSTNVAGCFLAFLGLWLIYRASYWIEEAPSEDPGIFRNRGPIFGALVVLLLLAAWPLLDWATWKEDRRMRNDIGNMAWVAGLGIDPEEVSQLAGEPGEERLVVHQKIKNQLRAILDSGEKFRFVYLVEMQDGEIRFLLDAEAADSPDYSPPGQIYEDYSPELLEAFQTGGPTTDGPYEDPWGRWISAFVKVEGSSAEGNPVLLGMDRDANLWNYELLVVRARVLGVLLLFTVVVTASFWISRLSLENRWRIGKAQEKLRESLSDTGIGVWEWTIPGDEFRLTGSGVSGMGRGKETRKQLGDFIESIAEPHRQRLSTAFAKLKNGLATTLMEEVALKDPGANEAPHRWVLVRGKCSRKAPDGAILQVVGSVVDITLDRRTKVILEALAVASSKVLQAPLRAASDWNPVLEIFGRRLDLDRVYVFQNHPAEDGGQRCSQLAEWCAEGIEPQIQNPALQEIEMETAGFGRWVSTLSGGGELHGDITGFPEGERLLLEAQGIRSIVVVPVFVGRKWWGFLGFDLCRRERDWEQPEVALLRSAANLFGNRLEIEETEAALRESRDAADAANRAKSAFLATMSHEIRTPLNAIIGMSTILIESARDSSVQDHARTIHTAGEGLLDLISGILDYSKIEAGKLEIEKKPFDPSALLREAGAVAGALAAKISLEFVLDADNTLPPALLGDATRLKQVLWNLLSNAVKFCDHGKVTLRAKRTDTGGSGIARVRFDVEDTGIGIPPETLRRLFRPFIQADSSVTRKYGGSGLGLAISRRLVELMGSEIRVESTEASGSIFSFEIDFEIASTPVSVKESGESEPARKPGGPKGGLRLLVAEDNPANQKVLLLMLRKLGLTADVVENGALAVEGAERGGYDVIFLDVQMPVLDGLSAARQIHERYADNPSARPVLIALTANAFTEDEENCKAAGMDFYLSKPVTLPRLRDTLDHAVASKSA